MMICRHSLMVAVVSAALNAAAPAVQAEADGPDYFAVRNVASWDKLNMRAGPAASYQIVHQIAHDARGIENIGGCVGSWCQVRYQGAIGWVHSGYLAEDWPAPAPGPIYRVIGVDWNDVLNMRAGPSTGYAIVGAIPPGGAGVVQTGPCAGGWCTVSHQGRVGWVNMRFLTPQP